MKRFFLTLLAILFLLVGLVLAGTGTFLAAAGGTQGKLNNSAGTSAGSGNALIFNDFAIDTGGVDTSKVVEMTVGAKSLNGKSLFIGLGATGDVVNYFNDVPRDVVTGISGASSKVTPIPGAQQPAPPTQQSFWLESATGTNPTVVLPGATSGSTLVVMNEDGSANVSIELTVGVESPKVFYTAIGLIVAGIILIILSIFLFRKAGKIGRANKQAKLAQQQAAAAPPVAPMPHGQIPNQPPAAPTPPVDLGNAPPPAPPVQ